MPVTLDTHHIEADCQQILELTDVPTMNDVEDTVRRLRGHLMQLIPAVEDAMDGHRGEALRVRAMHGVGEARRKLDATARPGLPGTIAYAQQLARSATALLTHLGATG